jgi:hypothetical protein
MIKVKDKAIKEYLESICDKTKVFQRTLHYDLTYMNTKELVCKNIKPWDSKYLLEDSKVNTIVDNRQVLMIWRNYITKLYDRPNGP